MNAVTANTSIYINAIAYSFVCMHVVCQSSFQATLVKFNGICIFIPNVSATKFGTDLNMTDTTKLFFWFGAPRLFSKTHKNNHFNDGG